MRTLTTQVSRLALAAGMSFMLASAAHAELTANGTAPGTKVDNTFTLDYTVGTVTQPTIAPSTETTFFVDRIIDLTFTGGPVSTATVNAGNVVTAPNATGTTHTYTLTNEGNDHFSYSFDFTTFAGAIAGIDENDVTLTYQITRSAAIDLNNDGDTADDCEGTTVNGTISAFTDVDAAPATAALSFPGGVATADITCPIAPDEAIDITVAVAVPGDATDGQTRTFEVIAEVREPEQWVTQGDTDTPVSVVATLGDNVAKDTTNTADVDNVFRDNDNGPADIAEDGQSSLADGVEVQSPDLVASKYAWVIDDAPASDADCQPSTLPTSDPGLFPVPGACVAYVIEVTNTSQELGNDATGVIIVDDLPDDVEFLSFDASTFDGTPAVTTKKGYANTGTDCDGTADEDCRVRLTAGEVDGTASADNVARLYIWTKLR